MKGEKNYQKLVENVFWHFSITTKFQDRLGCMDERTDTMILRIDYESQNDFDTLQCKFSEHLWVQIRCNTLDNSSIWLLWYSSCFDSLCCLSLSFCVYWYSHWLHEYIIPVLILCVALYDQAIMLDSYTGHMYTTPSCLVLVWRFIPNLF